MLLIVIHSLSRETVDKADDIKCCVVSTLGLRNSFHDQFHRHLLSRIQSHPICHNGELEKPNLDSAFNIGTFSNTQVTTIVTASDYVHVQLLAHVTMYTVCGNGHMR